MKQGLADFGLKLKAKRHIHILKTWIMGTVGVWQDISSFLPHKYEIKCQRQSWTGSLRRKSVLICSASSLRRSHCHCQHFYYGWLGRPLCPLANYSVSHQYFTLPSFLSLSAVLPPFTITWPPRQHKDKLDNNKYYLHLITGRMCLSAKIWKVLKTHQQSHNNYIT